MVVQLIGEYWDVGVAIMLLIAKTAFLKSSVQIRN